MPKVSVVLPTYNRALLLTRAVRRVQQQTLRDWELLVVDDESDDDSARVIQPFLADRRIRWLSQRHAGVSAARNLGVAHASGEFVAFLDSDDEWTPAKLEKQVALLEAHADAAMAVTWCDVVDPQGRHLGYFRPNDRNVIERLVEKNVLPGAASSSLVRRTAFIDVGGFDNEMAFSADWDLWIRLAAHGPVLVVPEPLVRYQSNPGLSNWRGADVEGDVRRTYRNLRARPNLPRHLRRRSHEIRGLASVVRFHWQEGNRVDAARLLTEMLLRSPAHTYRAFLEYVETRRSRPSDELG